MSAHRSHILSKFVSAALAVTMPFLTGFTTGDQLTLTSASNIRTSNTYHSWNDNKLSKYGFAAGTELEVVGANNDNFSSDNCGVKVKFKEGSVGRQTYGDGEFWIYLDREDPAFEIYSKDGERKSAQTECRFREAQRGAQMTTEPEPTLAVADSSLGFIFPNRSHQVRPDPTPRRGMRYRSGPRRPGRRILSAQRRVEVTATDEHTRDHSHSERSIASSTPSTTILTDIAAIIGNEDQDRGFFSFEQGDTAVLSERTPAHDTLHSLRVFEDEIPSSGLACGKYEADPDRWDGFRAQHFPNDGLGEQRTRRFVDIPATSPLDETDIHRYSSLFGMRDLHNNGNWKHHNGIDVAVPSNSPFRSMSVARVVQKGNQHRGAGLYLVLESPNGDCLKVAHLNRILVNVGDEVDVSQIVARTGSTGHSTGPHAHIEHITTRNRKMVAVDPKALIDSLRDRNQSRVISATI